MRSRSSGQSGQEEEGQTVPKYQEILNAIFSGVDKEGNPTLTEAGKLLNETLAKEVKMARERKSLEKKELELLRSKDAAYMKRLETELLAKRIERSKEKAEEEEREKEYHRKHPPVSVKRQDAVKEAAADKFKARAGSDSGSQNKTTVSSDSGSRFRDKVSEKH